MCVQNPEFAKLIPRAIKYHETRYQKKRGYSDQ